MLDCHRNITPIIIFIFKSFAGHVGISKYYFGKDISSLQAVQPPNRNYVTRIESPIEVWVASGVMKGKQKPKKDQRDSQSHLTREQANQRNIGQKRPTSNEKRALCH